MQKTFRKVFYQASRKEGELAKTFQDWLAKYHDWEIEHLCAQNTALMPWKAEDRYSVEYHGATTMGSIFCVIKKAGGDGCQE